MKINNLKKCIATVVLGLMIGFGAQAQQPNPLAEKYDEFTLIDKAQDQEKFYKDLIKKIPETEKNRKLYDRIRGAIAINWLHEENFDKFKQYDQSVKDGLSLFELTNILEKWLDDKKNLAWMDVTSKQYLKDIENGLRKDDFEHAHEVLLEISATIDCINGDKSAALAKINEALKDAKMRNMNYFKDSKPNFISRYAFILDANGQTQKAIDTLTVSVKDAESNPKLLAILKTIYAKVNGEDNATKYVASLQDEAYQRYYKELESKWDPIGKPAPTVAITKLNGQEFKVSDYKGKILVVDFWSTTCTPCKACFPAFERIVADYKNEPFQLFVAGIAEDKETQQQYVDKSKLTLDVLRDPEMAFYKAIGAKGTPHKFIIDPKGIIRMDGIGYAGSTDREYYEVKAMIEITKKHAANNN
ncbi:TlpA family protein disulfide reductase [Pedobacter riviphilus]|uniref:TlpA family protein disulfide reductase n=1 Tax=Pedobacter riviphilus TaxID=2766984 RepID=A0ABX6THL8_9SPHI|nr:MULTISPECIES: TlpA disulfide reductase family protein [Pedobacter]NII81022.1 peroxiredoxin [Pedobacter sp. SG908]NMN35037.1 peroxiredoxin [Pedobacter sp. SG918]QNR85012.1 TlpA family protein disulfide reductase [Pedobacter riviphilus]